MRNTSPLAGSQSIAGSTPELSVAKGSDHVTWVELRPGDVTLRTGGGHVMTGFSLSEIIVQTFLTVRVNYFGNENNFFGVSLASNTERSLS